jgi:hypothetical protein
VPSLLLRDKRDFAAKGALIIRGVVGARFVDLASNAHVGEPAL